MTGSERRRAASLRKSHFFDQSGDSINTDGALALIRSGNASDETVHELLLLCGAAHGRAILRKAITALGGASNALLFTNAAYEPRATDHLWEKVYIKLSFRRVANLRVSLDGDEEIPMVTSLGALAEKLG